MFTSCKYAMKRALPATSLVDPSWNVMAHGDLREWKWGGNWQVEWVASTLHTTSEHGVSIITTADAHTSAANSRLNWRPPRRFKWTRPFRRKTKSGFCACAITFQLASTCCSKCSVVSSSTSLCCFPSYLLLYVRHLLEILGIIRYMAVFKTLFLLFFL